MRFSYKEALAIINQKIDELLKEKASVIIGLDGMAASGKTTLAQYLKNQYNSSVIHMDDFFLQDHQKTDIRLNEIDGYVDYERFMDQVIIPLRKGVPFTYHPYHCQNKTFSNKHIDNKSKLYIIEGAYALRKAFCDLYDLKILMLIDGEKQLSRISERNKPDMVKRFKEEWIPRENKYIERCKLEEVADITILVK